MKDLVHIQRKAAEASLIASLARSQHALARILDSVADLTGESPIMVKLLRDNVHTLTAYQETMAEAVTGQAWRKRMKHRGQAQTPWLHPDIRLITQSAKE